MTTFLKTLSVLAFVTLMTMTMGSSVAGQGQTAAGGQAGGRGGPPAPPAPILPQAGHPTGKLVIWGDLVNFERPGTPNRCLAQNRFKRGGRVGFRMTAIDGGTGEVENTAVQTVHVAYAGRTIDVPMRWRGNMSFPAQEYMHAPLEMWTGEWTVPDDAPVGALTYTVTATDRFGRTASYAPFPNHLSQLEIVEQ